VKAYLTKRYWFSASHRLHREDLPAENRDLYGKCNNPHGHGHNYALEVTLAGRVNPETGMVCNLADLDAFIHENILERFGHENLNTLPEFHGVAPTTENLCIEIYSILAQGFHHAEVEKIRMEETMLNSFEYAGGREIRV